MNNLELVIADKNGKELYTFTTEQDKEKDLHLANRSTRLHIERYSELILDYPDRAEYWTSCLNRHKAISWEIMTYEDFREREKKNLITGELLEITKEDFDEHFNMLPPLKWCTRHNVEMFCMREMYTGTYTTQYAYSLVTGKYYCTMVDVTDPETWIDKILDKAA